MQKVDFTSETKPSKECTFFFWLYSKLECFGFTYSSWAAPNTGFWDDTQSQGWKFSFISCFKIALRENTSNEWKKTKQCCTVSSALPSCMVAWSDIKDDLQESLLTVTFLMNMKNFFEIKGRLVFLWQESPLLCCQNSNIVCQPGDWRTNHLSPHGLRTFRNSSQFLFSM